MAYQYDSEVVVNQIPRVIAWLQKKADNAGDSTVEVSGLDCKVASDLITGLERENHRLRSIVRAVASSNPYESWYSATNSPAGVVCRWCMERAQSPKECQHDHECTWRQAREANIN